MSKPGHSDAEWRHFVKVDEEITEERRRALLASQEAMEKVLRLERHETLLRSHADDFISCDYKEISDLVELDCRAAEEIARLEKERIAALAAKQSCLAREVEGFVSEKAGLISECGASSSGRIVSSPSGDGNQTRASTPESPTPTQIIVSTDSLRYTFWDDLDIFLAGDARKSPSPVDDTVEPAGSSPSGS